MPSSGMREDLLERSRLLKKEWDEAQPLGAEQNQRLWQKLRLEWNYNSNHIEGNTLTYGETQLLLIKGQTTGDHSIREYEEMKAHDVAIGHIRSLAEDSRPITEADVRDLNRILLKEPFWKEAITPEGQPTQKEIIPGHYKSTPNNVRTATGEIFQFATPEETPAKMAALVESFRRELESTEIVLPKFLAKFHHEFSLVHPFDDGNGRTMRLLLNYALLRSGYPPIVIKSAEKKKYLSALNFADAGNLEPFEDFIVEQIIWSLELGIKAGKGESLEEPEDWEKEVSVFVREHRKPTTNAPEKNKELLLERWDDSWKPLRQRLESKLSAWKKIFTEVSVRMELWPLSPYHEHTGDRPFENRLAIDPSVSGIRWYVELGGYSGSGSENIGTSQVLEASLSKTRYSFQIIGQPVPIVVNLRYDAPLSSDHISLISSHVGKHIIGIVKLMLGEAPLP